VKEQKFDQSGNRIRELLGRPANRMDDSYADAHVDRERMLGIERPVGVNRHERRANRARGY
jgi:hypothetical protein